MVKIHTRSFPILDNYQTTQTKLKISSISYEFSIFPVFHINFPVITGSSYILPVYCSSYELLDTPYPHRTIKIFITKTWSRILGGLSYFWDHKEKTSSRLLFQMPKRSILITNLV